MAKKAWRRPLKATERLGSSVPGGYVVQNRQDNPVTRPTKNAAGMQYTYNRVRAGWFAKEDALKLLTQGTTDVLSKGLQFKVARAPCPHCGSKSNTKLVLTERGRLRLRVLRRLRQRSAEDIIVRANRDGERTYTKLDQSN